VELETAFGEVLRADAVVLAPGLSLGGRLLVGELEMVGGRYGETPSDRLMESLAALGAQWAESTLLVGARFGAAGAHAEEAWPSALLGAGPAGVVSAAAMSPRSGPVEVGEAGLGRPGEGRGTSGETEAEWGCDMPPSPYFGTGEGGPRFKRWLDAGTTLGEGTWGAYPDGFATGEAYVVPSVWGDAERSLAGAESRLPQTIRGLVVRNVDGGGRFVGRGMGPGRVWVAGRAAGACGYLESLASGVRVARCVVEELRAAYGGGCVLGSHALGGPAFGLGSGGGAVAGRP
jgi:hypothetical protein